MYNSNGLLTKATYIQKITFKKLSKLNRNSIFEELQFLANDYKNEPGATDNRYTSYPNWQLGKVGIADKHGIHRNHVNAIIREFSGKSSSSRVSQRLPIP